MALPPPTTFMHYVTATGKNEPPPEKAPALTSGVDPAAAWHKAISARAPDPEKAPPQPFVLGPRIDQAAAWLKAITPPKA